MRRFRAVAGLVVVLACFTATAAFAQDAQGGARLIDWAAVGAGGTILAVGVAWMAISRSDRKYIAERIDGNRDRIEAAGKEFAVKIDADRRDFAAKIDADRRASDARAEDNRRELAVKMAADRKELADESDKAHAMIGANIAKLREETISRFEKLDSRIKADKRASDAEAAAEAAAERLLQLAVVHAQNLARNERHRP